MRIKRIAIVFIFPVFFFSCSKKSNSCTEEQIVQKQKDFNSAYQNWKEALNFMDTDVINSSKNHLDSSYQELVTCTNIHSNLIAEVDSISLIFTNYNVKRLQIEKGEKKIKELDKLISSITSKEE